MRVLGFDPGTAATGYGIVLFESGRLRLEDCGVWRPSPGLVLAERLEVLLQRSAHLIGECQPAAWSVATVVACRYDTSAQRLSHAQGILEAAGVRAAD